MGMIGYHDRYFTMDAIHLTWYDEKDFQLKSTSAAALGSVQISDIKGFDLVPGTSKGKYGIELKGPDKSYFLWATSQEAIEDFFRKFQTLARK